MKSKGYRKNKKGLTKTEKQEVKAIVAADTEDKIVSSYDPNVYHNSGIGSGDLVAIVPRITQGTGQGDRVGNELMCKKLSLNLILNISFNAHISRSRIGVRIFCFSVKGYESAPAAVTGASQWIDSFLREGNSVRNFSGDTRSFFLPHNNKAITMHAERKIYLSAPFQWNTSLTPPPAASLAIQSVYMTKFLKINIPCKNKKLTYSRLTNAGNVDNVPNNWGPLLAIGYCKLDGSAPDALDTGLQTSTLSVLTFEDK